MKNKISPHHVTVIAIVVLIILGLACASSPKTADDELVWDEGLTIGVTRITDDGVVKDTLRVSPDGTKLLYAEATKKDSDGYWAWNIVYLRDANNPAKTPLINDFAFAPSWYEDNIRFLYVSYENRAGRVVRSSTAGGGKTYITRMPIGDSDNSPIVRNGLIVLSTWMNEKWQLVTVKENGTEPTFVGDGRWPSWHPTENKVVFIREGKIYEMDIDQGYQVTMLYSDDNFDCYQPSYSPDGKKILFAKGALTRVNLTSKKTSKKNENNATLEELERTHIFVMEADGSNLSPISSGKANVSSPSWGRNGEIFCMVSISNKPKEIYKLRLRGMEETSQPVTVVQPTTVSEASVVASDATDFTDE